MNRDAEQVPAAGNDARPEGAPPSTSVCLVEDHEAVRAHVADLLRSKGHDVVAAVGTIASGEQAIVEHQPQIAVIDARLSDGNGVDLCRRLRIAAPEVPLILYSAQISSEEEHAALDLGVSAVVLKNVRTDELLQAIRQHARP